VIKNGSSPLNGTKDDTFEFRVKFTDKDGDLPIPEDGGYIYIIINGVRYSMVEMVKNNTDSTIGKFYNFSIKGSELNPGANTFQILAHDGTYLTKSLIINGPEVSFGELPVADAGDDFSVKVNEMFYFDGSGSYDPDGNIVRWLWDTDGDGDFADSGGSKEGEKVSYRYEVEGKKTITLMVIDDDGNRKTITIDEAGTYNTTTGDIGPKTVGKFNEIIMNCKTIIANGPPGIFEKEVFRKATNDMVDSMVKATKENNALTIIGGGEMGAAAAMSGKADGISFISTAGGAMLEILSGNDLPMIRALREKKI